MLKQIPKAWLTLNVKAWHVYKSYRGGWPQADNSFEHIYIDVFSEDWKEDEETEKKEDSQLEGQISINDFIN